MDILALFWNLLNSVRLYAQDIRVSHDIVQGPLISLVLPRDLLTDSREEALGIGEASDPVRPHLPTTMFEPRIKLRVPIEEASEPAADARQQPRYLTASGIVRPSLGHSTV
eukprot:CAMPEP_0178394288 /NCGR_PEP_ID=MMETSP0689_2-20121128/12628_1 /TAXON_ID=160604 /ORGANISM="Amphidinium massartii, Strain CS-259" /LENGTH=110 /DNA_ID=CAMNT_0020014911 /DNA_START=279 /DNA_END=607 /DNA_ORIENTATION=+